MSPSLEIPAPAVAVPRTATPSDRDEQDRLLLRRVTEACNDTTLTTVLFRRVVADISDTMGWGSGRVLEITGDPAEPLRPSVEHDDGSAGDPEPRPVGPNASRPVAVRASRAAVDALTAAEPVVDLGVSSDVPGVALRHVVAIPVIAADGVAAVLEFAAPEFRLDPDRARLLRGLGRQLGHVVDRERVLSELAQRSEELERSNGELERFAYVASHDLQEPLRKMVGFAELLSQRYDDVLDETGREYLGYVVDGAQRMQRLIKDLLAYSRAGRSAPRWTPVDLNDLTEQLLDSLQWAMDDANAQVSVGPLPTVRGDADQLAVVLGNLLTNAAKYASTGAPRITVAAAPVDGERMWEITVTDDGIGIAPEYREQVFEVFRRLHGPSEYPGTGIGLAITRRLVEAHGGTIWVTSSTPKGCTFHFTLPQDPQETSR